MKLIIGLGNIGDHFDGTRHNIGFAAAEYIAKQFGLEWQNKDKFKAHIAEGSVWGQKVIIARPTTYYNLVGESAQAIKTFYKLHNSDILAIHDELALPFGTLRLRSGGRDAGNNGIKSLIQHLGDDFARIRIGTANNRNTDATDFVLGNFEKQELLLIPKVLQQAEKFARYFVLDEKFEHTSVRINGNF